MAIYDLILTQNILSGGDIEWNEVLVNISKGDLLSANSSSIPTVLDTAAGDDYALVSDSNEVTGMKWVPWSTLVEGGLNYGSEDQIPHMNTAGDGFDYTPNFTYDGSTLLLANGAGLDQYWYQIVLGADSVGAFTTRTDAVNKMGRLVVPHYNTSEEPVSAFGITANVISTLDLGGGNALENAVNRIRLYAAVDNVTTGGTEVGRFDVTGFLVDDIHELTASAGITLNDNVILSEYGTGTYELGGETYLLGVDASGNVVEVSSFFDLNFGTQYQIPITNAAGDNFVYDDGLTYNTAFSVLTLGDRSVSTAVSIEAAAGTAALNNAVHLRLVGGTPYDTAGANAGNVYILGGDARSSDPASLSGNIYIWGGASNGTDPRGTIYFGNGSSIGTLQPRGSEGNVVYYDTTTGLLTYGDGSGLTGVAVNYGTDNQIPYMNGTTAFQYSSGLLYDDTNLQLTSYINFTTGNAELRYGDVRRFYIDETSYTVLIGNNASVITSGATYSVYIGYYTGNSIVDTDYNTMIGARAGEYTTGSSNTLIGFRAGYGTTGITTYSNIIAIGSDALYSLTTGSGHTAVGYGAMASVTTAGSNSAFGNSAARYQEGGANTFIGYHSGQGLSSNHGTGTYITTLGYNAGGRLVDGGGSTFIGAQAGFGSDGTNGVTGSYNTALGYSALIDVTTGGYNIAIGPTALGDLTTGSSNITIGYQAGNVLTTGSSNIYIGREVDATATDSTYELKIGYTSTISISGNLQTGELSFDQYTSAHTFDDASPDRLLGTDTAGNIVQVDPAGIGGSGGISFGTAQYQIPYTNVSLDDFDYTSLFTYDGTMFRLPNNNYISFNNYVDLREGGASATRILSYTGNNSLFIGDGVAHTATGIGNIAIGYNAGSSLTSGSYNTLFGGYAGAAITGVTANVIAFGYEAGRYATGTGNTLIGYQAGRGDGLTTPTGTLNVFIGYQAGANFTTAQTSVAIGYHAGQNITTGSGWTAIGHSTGQNMTAVSWTAIGHGAADAATTGGNDCTIIGYGAGGLATDIGDDNVLIGYIAGQSLAGDRNVVIGHSAGVYTETSQYNVIIGMLAGGYNDGDYNVFIGYLSGYGVTPVASNTGNYNTGVGGRSLQNISTGIGNTAIGYSAGDSITTGDYNIILGYNVDALADDNYQLKIGYFTTVTIEATLNTGEIAFPEYDSAHTFDDASPDRLLGTDASGNIVQVDPAGIGGGGGISWGTATNEYIVLGSSPGDIESSADLQYNTSTYTMQVGAVGNNFLIKAIDASSSNGIDLTIEGSDADGATNDAGPVIIKGGDGVPADSNSSGGAVHLIPGAHGTLTAGIVYLGHSTLSSISSFTIQAESTATNATLFINPKGTGNINLGTSTTANGYLYGTTSIRLATPTIRVGVDEDSRIEGASGSVSVNSGYDLTIKGGQAYSGSGDGAGGDVIITGGVPRAAGNGDGGSIYIYPSTPTGAGAVANTYFGTGAAGALTEDVAATEVVTYDTTTGLLNYIQTSSLGGGGDVSWGTPTNYYLTMGDSVSGNITSSNLLHWSTSTHRLTLDGGAGDGAELYLSYNSNNTFRVIAADTSAIVSSTGQALAAGSHLIIRGGESSSTTGTHDGGNLTLVGGEQSGATGGDGGNVYLYGGQSTNGSAGQIYFGDGTSIGGLTEDVAATEVVTYDTTTGLLNYIQTSSLGGGISWGTASNDYIVLGSSGGDIESSSALNFTSDILSATRDDASTNTIIEVANFTRTSTTTTGDGAGGYIDINVADDADFLRPLRIQHVLTDVSTSTVNSLFRVQGYFGGGAITQFLYINGFNSYDGHGSGAIGLGPDTTSSNINTIAIGREANATASTSVAIGGNATSTGVGGIAIGNGADAGATGIVAIGTGAGSTSGTTGLDAISIGRNTNEDALNMGTGSISMGRYSSATAQGSILMGYHSSEQSNTLTDSFKLMWDGTTGFHVGLTLGTQVTVNADPVSNLTDAANGALAYDSTDNELQAYIGGSWQTLSTGGSVSFGSAQYQIPYTNSGLNGFSYNAGFIFNGSDIFLAGGSAGSGLTSGGNTVAIGQSALTECSTNSYNIALGNNAARYQAGPSNIAIGTGAMQGVTGTTSGNYNIAIGSSALFDITSGTYNTAVGYQALTNVTSGSNNVGIGRDAGNSITTTSGNVYVGYSTGTHHTGSNSVFVGTYAGIYIVGTGNVAVGYYAGAGAFSSGAGTYNTNIGYTSGYGLEDGDYNVGIGYQSLYDVTDGNSNVAIGHDSGHFILGSQNILIGKEAGYGVSTTSDGINNIGIGYRSLYAYTTGDYNICIGYQAGDTITTGNRNILIGYGMDVSAGDSNKFKLGDNTVVLMSGDTTNGAITFDNYGINTFTGSAAYNIEVDGSGNLVETSAGSDIRFKKYISPIKNPLSLVLALQGYTFIYNKLGQKFTGRDNSKRSGFVAQEVNKIFPEVVKSIGSTDYLKIEYEHMVPLLAEGIKEHYKKTETHEEKIKRLEERVLELENEVETLKN